MIDKVTATLVLLAAMLGLAGCAPVIFAGATTGGVAALDNRTTGAFVEDEGIEIRAKKELLEQIGTRARYDVVSMNRVVLLIGQAPDEALKQEIEGIVKQVPNVRRLINQMTIGPEADLRQRAEDTLITSKIIANLVAIQDGDFSKLDVKVVTEQNVVYLMGLVTQENAAKAIDVARKVEGVKQVTQAFEFI